VCNSPLIAGLRIGFISTRFAGTDGVSLETEKWATVLQRCGHHCYYFAGECDEPDEVSYVVPEAFFHHPVIIEINKVIFDANTRPPLLTRRIMELKDFFKEHLYTFVKQYDLNLFIVENALAIPINISLGLAITEYIAETGMPTIAHHHDLFWERKRFLTNCVWDYINMAFPPHLACVQHVVINTSAANQLALRTGISSTLIPNVMDFDNPPLQSDPYSQSVRSDLGLAPEEYLILQPTRIVQRKGIEHAIELVRRLELPARLVISHASGDEGYEYEQRVRQAANTQKVPTLFVSDIIKEKRGYLEDGRKVYTLADVYRSADLVTYPSDIEGFGNAFLEAIFYSLPIVVNNYSIFSIDIKPRGFRVIEFDGYVTDQTVELTRRVLTEKDLADEMAATNYRLAKRFYSYALLKRRLEYLITRLFGE
jgi:glycosyltransferase involved in cell wall biosynthesis